MSDTQPGFSVIIPVYNGEKFIAGAIQSCLQQTVLPVEIIVVDDASNDDTPAIVQSFDSALVKYSRNSENRGPSFSRNRGMAMVRSSWILFLDADDVFHPEKIAIIGQCIDRNKNIRAIGHSFEVTGNASAKQADQRLRSPFKLKMFSADEVLLRNPIVTPALGVSSQNGILFNEKMVFAEDHDFILRTTETFGVWFLNIPLCSLNRRPLTTGGISNNRWMMRKGEMNMYIDYCKRNKLYPAIPFFLLFSLAKHLKNMIFLKNR
jgi:teichuronic acid biosynthesis glycosyltransferase TuaG